MRANLVTLFVYKMKVKGQRLKSTLTKPKCFRMRFRFFSNNLRLFRSNFLVKKSSCRHDRFGPKLVKIQAILLIFQPFEV